jgi:hypothetical protein
MSHKKEIQIKEFLLNCNQIINSRYFKDDQKLDIIVTLLSGIESDIENILIKIISSKARDRLDKLKESSNLLDDCLNFIENKRRGKDSKSYKDRLISKCGAFFKKNYPTVVCDYRKFEEE